MNYITCQKLLSGKQKKYCSKKCKNDALNPVLQKYSLQKEKGFERKLKLLETFGSKCSVCGYDNNYAALCFHHTRDKTFGIDLRQCSNTKWETLVEEAKKCVVMCHNCHMEHHNPQFTKLVGLDGFEPTVFPL
mgnify:CR=1 FL=1